MTHTVRIQSIEPVTHDTRHLVVTRPDGFSFTPGQATNMAVDREGWRDSKRPFTFTGDPDADRLEFIIKIYPDHDGVTEQIGKLKVGDTLLITDAWGAITDQGPGVFIAGGAGITPFIAILRERARQQDGLAGCTLIFSNKTERDVILRDEWEAMEGLSVFFVLTDEGTDALPRQRIDRDYLEQRVHGWRENFYVCGPPGMIDAVTEILRLEGVPDDRVIVEDL